MGGFFISLEALDGILSSEAMLQIVDVRKRAAFEADGTVLPTACRGDPEDIETWHAELDPSVPVVLYCVHGHEVSQGAAATLRDKGFDARVLEGGITAWRESGRAVRDAGTRAGGRSG